MMTQNDFVDVILSLSADGQFQTGEISQIKGFVSIGNASKTRAIRLWIEQREEDGTLKLLGSLLDENTFGFADVPFRIGNFDPIVDARRCIGKIKQNVFCGKRWSNGICSHSCQQKQQPRCGEHLKKKKEQTSVLVRSTCVYN